MSESDYEQIKLSNQLCFSLYSANNAVIRAYRPFLEKIDLTYSQFIVMMALWEQDGINLKTLSEQTRLDSGTLTPLLKRLEKKGFLSREQSQEDERQKILTLTEQGRMVRDEAAKVPELVKCKIALPKNTLKKTLTYCEEITSQLSKKS